MPLDTSQFVKVSSLHGLPIVTACEIRPNVVMARSVKDISARLVATQHALGLSAAEICRQTGISPNQWSQFTNPKYKRPITLAAAYKLKDAFGVTLEWTYDGDRSRLPFDIADKLRHAA